MKPSLSLVALAAVAAPALAQLGNLPQCAVSSLRPQRKIMLGAAGETLLWLTSYRLRTRALADGNVDLGRFLGQP